MKNILLLLAIILLNACASRDYEVDILEKGFGDDLEYMGINYTVGPWYMFNDSYGFQINDIEIKVAIKNKYDFVTHRILLRDCPNIIDEIENLKMAAFETSKVALGISPPKKTNIITLDGPDYKLKIYSNEMHGSLILEGGSNSRHVTPWIKAANKIREIAGICTKS